MSLLLDTHSIVTIGAADTFPPRIGAHTLYRESGASVTASAETDGGEKENAYKEGLTFDFWRPGVGGVNWLRVHLTQGAQSANYLAIAAHDLHQHQAWVKAQYSTDGGVTWTDASSDFSPGDSSPIMILFDDVFGADFRLYVSSVSAPSIGVVHIGRVLKLDAPLPGPWTPPHLARANQYINEVSEGGAFLGRSLIAGGATLQLNIEGVGMPWIRSEWEDTVRLLETHGFFFAARDLAAAGGVGEAEVFYGWTAGQPMARYSSNTYGSIHLAARGIIT